MTQIPAADVAERLLNGGLTDPRVLEGSRGLQHFGPHGLTQLNQADVIQHVRTKLEARRTVRL